MECIISSCRFNWGSLRAKRSPLLCRICLFGLFPLFPLFKNSQSLFKAAKQVLEQIDPILRVMISNNSNNYSLPRTDGEVKNQRLEKSVSWQINEVNRYCFSAPTDFLSQHFLCFFFFNTLLSTYYYRYTYCLHTHYYNIQMIKKLFAKLILSLE